MIQHRRRFRDLLVLSYVAFLATCLDPSAVDAGRLVYTMTLQSSQVVLRTEGGEIAIWVDDGQYFTLQDDGLPQLPYRVVSFVLPQGEVVDRIEFKAEDTVVIAEGVNVNFAGPAVSDDGLTGPRVPLASVANGVYPAENGRYLGTGYLHGYAVASAAVFPLRVYGEELSLARSVTVEVFTRPDEPDFEVIARKRFIEGFHSQAERTLSSHVVNAADMR